MFLIFILFNLAQAQFDCVDRDIAATICVDNGIDPRIVTPDGNQGSANCPLGYVACVARCGVSTVPPQTPSGTSVPGQNPWLAFLRINGVYLGAGVLIDSTHVLTAGHKVYLVPPQAVSISMGLFNPNSAEASRQEFQVTRIVIANNTIHNNAVHYFDNNTLKNDIAILTLSRPALFSRFVLPACTPVPFSMPQMQNCIVSGWGESSFGANDAPTIQKHVTVPIVPMDTCRQEFQSLGVNTALYIDDDPLELCAGGQNQMDACTYDGGAPLMCSVDGALVVTGLVIWGKGCGRPQVYGVYVNVASYQTWIDQLT